MNKHQLPGLSNAGLNWGAIQIAGLYLLVGGLWILFSDQFAARIALNQQMLTTISLYKGWGYVLVTALALYWLISLHTSRLKQSEESYKLLAENITDVIWVLDLETSHFRYVSPSVERLRGYTAREVLMQDMSTSRAPDSARFLEKILPERIKEFKEGNDLTYTDEVEQPHKNGTAVWTETRTRFVVNKDSGHLEVYGVSRDISERKQVEMELRQWADAFEGCAHGIAIGDPNTNRIVVCNPAFAAMHKCRAEDLVGSAILSLYMPSDHEQVRRNIQKADQIGHSRFEARMRRRDGTTFPVQMDLVSVLGEDGDVLHRVATAQNISERKQAEEKLLIQAHWLDKINDAVITTDQDLILTAWNPAAERIYGWKAEEVVGKKGEEVLKSEVFSRSRQEVLQELKETGEFSAEITQIRKDGSRIQIETRTVTLRDENGQILGHVSVNRDITKRVEAEEEIKRLARFPAENPSPVLRATHEGKIVYANTASQPLLEDWRSTIGNYLPPEWVNFIGGPINTGSKKIIDVQCGDLIYSIMIVPIPDTNEVNIYGRDVTERKRAEEALRRSEALLLQTGELAKVGGWELDLQTMTLVWSLETYRIHEVDPSFQPDVEKAIDYYTPQSRPIIREAVQQAIEEGEPFDLELPIVTAKGKPLWVRAMGQVEIRNGERVRLFGTLQDITERKQAEENLRRFELLSEHSRDIILFMGSKDGRILEANAAAIQAYGYSRDELLALTIRDLRASHTQELTADQMAQADAGGILFETVHRRKDGTTFPVEVSSQGATIGGVRSLISIVRDITERKETDQALQRAHDELELKVQERTAALSEANALLQALMDHMPDHIYFKDTQSRFIRNSRSQAILLGLKDPAEAVGKTDFDFFPHAAKAYAEEQEVMRSGTPLVDFEEWVVWPDGREMWVSTTKVPLQNSEGQTIGIFGISHDITERKHTEQAIRQLNSDLENQAAQLQAANKELEAFSYSVSHDLRAPLRAIDGYTRILVEDYETALDAEGKRICGIISAEARRMGQLIDDLLAFSRLGRKQMFSSKIDMKALVGSVFDDLVKGQDRDRIDFEMAKLPSTKGDLSLFRQVWVNLISNALKFTSKKERAVIEVGCRHGKDENIYYVRDNGAGFDMEYADKLFGVFQRLHGESEFEGTGVGLAIVQRIIRRHGGRVWAEGEVDKGATFYFALPKKENHS